MTKSASDYETFSVTQSAIPGAPASAGGTSLPGNIYTDGFYVPKPGTVVGATNYVGLSDQLFPGSNVTDHWNGFDISLNARLGHGIIFQGGTGIGHQVTDNCDIVDPANAGRFGSRSPLVESLGVTVGPVTTYSSIHSCHVDQAWLSQLKLIGSYTVPKIDVSIGASYQNIPGLELQANYQDFNSDVI